MIVTVRHECFCACGVLLERNDNAIRRGDGSLVHVGCERREQGAPDLFSLTAVPAEPKPAPGFRPVDLNSPAPRIELSERPRMGQLQKTFEILSDGEYHDPEEIAERLHCLPSSAASRVRDLRKKA